ncbi:MAG TPA: hypothetical protein VF306_22145, partial [Pirellulales bacterium]
IKGSKNRSSASFQAVSNSGIVSPSRRDVAVGRRRPSRHAFVPFVLRLAGFGGDASRAVIWV